MLRSERETSDGVGMCLEIGLTIYQRMSYFVFGVNMFLGWLRIKCSCEVMRRKCRGLIDLDKHYCAVKLQTAGEMCHGFAS